MVLGLKFLPNIFIGRSAQLYASSKQTFASLFLSFPHNSNCPDQPSIMLITPSSGSSVDGPSQWIG